MKNMTYLFALAALTLCGACASQPQAVSGPVASSSKMPGTAMVAFTPAQATRAGTMRVAARRPMFLLSRIDVQVRVEPGMETSALAAAIVAQTPESWTSGMRPVIQASGAAILFNGVTELAVDPGETGILITLEHEGGDL